MTEYVVTREDLLHTWIVKAHGAKEAIAAVWEEVTKNGTPASLTKEQLHARSIESLHSEVGKVAEIGPYLLERVCGEKSKSIKEWGSFKVGDTIWELDTYTDDIEAEVIECTISEIVREPDGIFVNIQSKENPKRDNYCLLRSELFHSLFLLEQDAEAAKERYNEEHTRAYHEAWGI